jgi:UDP-hydrolysing UDP-N-acetyl-D-glucosamine 2-epimerase
MIRRVAVVTGSRAEYGLLESTLDELERASDFECQLVVTGMHLDPEFNTVAEIETSGRVAARVPGRSAVDDATPKTRRVRELARELAGFAQAWDSLDPDLILVLGDRAEIFAAAASAVAANILLGHLHGGDRSEGGQDEAWRHAISKLAHLHFPATEASAERLRRLGEEPERITVIGLPGLDAIRAGRFTEPGQVLHQLGLPRTARPVTLCCHPISVDPDGSERMIDAILRAVADAGEPVLALAPNDDPGHERIRTRLERASDAGELTLIGHLGRPDFLGLVRASTAVVGNSSAGCLEVPALGTPALNVGSRQRGRERLAGVVDVEPDATAIAAQLRAVMAPGFVRPTPLAIEPGETTGARLVRRLRELVAESGSPDADPTACVTRGSIAELMQKRMTY